MNQLHQLLNLLDHANHLKQLPRTGWLFAGVAAPESIAEHTCVTTLLVLFLGEQVNVDWAAQGLEAPLDIAKAVRMALIHDLAESVVTDLPRRTSQLIGNQVKHAAEESALQMMLDDLPTAVADLDLLREYNAGASAEARLVKDADKLEMVHQAHKYKERGQANLNEFLSPTDFHYPISQSLFDYMLSGPKS